MRVPTRGPIAGFAEVPGHGIAARTRKIIDDHRFRSVNGLLGFGVGLALPGHDQAHHRPVQVVDDVVRQLAAAVEAFIEHRALLAHLGKIIAIEIGISGARRVGQINVGQLAAAEFVHLAAIAFDPCEVAQRRFHCPPEPRSPRVSLRRRDGGRL